MTGPTERFEDDEADLVDRPHDIHVCGIDYDCSCDECRRRLWPEKERP